MNENKEDQSPTKENMKQTDAPEGLEPVKSNSNPEKQMDIESESSKHENGKTSQKNGNGSAKKHPQQRHQQAKERPSLGIEEKKKLSREELKNLRAIELIEKMEQVSRSLREFLANLLFFVVAIQKKRRKLSKEAKKRPG